MKPTPRVDSQLVAEIRRKYSAVPQDVDEKIIGAIFSLLEHSQNQRNTTRSILDQAARLIYRLFEFKEIAIGLRSERDGLYRYECLIGYRREAEDAFRKLVYTYNDMTNDNKYPNVKTGLISEFNYLEGLPPTEEELYTYNRPDYILRKKRESVEEFLEGDYIDVLINGNDGELIGFIELSNTKDGKLPSRTSIRWIELIGVLLGIIIQKRKKQ